MFLQYGFWNYSETRNNIIGKGLTFQGDEGRQLQIELSRLVIKIQIKLMLKFEPTT